MNILYCVCLCILLGETHTTIMRPKKVLTLFLNYFLRRIIYNSTFSLLLAVCLFIVYTEGRRSGTFVVVAGSFFLSIERVCFINS